MKIRNSQFLVDNLDFEERVLRNEVPDEELQEFFQDVINTKTVSSLSPKLRSICKMLIMTGICEDE